VIYWVVVSIRNGLFNLSILPSDSFSIPIIGVGNLSAGGTGKTPLIEYLIELLESKGFIIGYLSRGYGRQTQGYYPAVENASAIELGDEAFQIHLKFPKVKVAVCENRNKGVKELLFNFPEIQVIVLDDVFQHRYIKPGLMILITSFDKPFFTDYILPAGTLRESKKGAKRADLIVVSKCPSNLEEKNISYFKNEINLFNQNEIFFSKIQYQKMKAFNTEKDNKFNIQGLNIVLFTGIADNRQIVNWLEGKVSNLIIHAFPDHHYFTKTDYEKIKRSVEGTNFDNTIALTTEKDISRIRNSEMEDFFKTLPLYYLPIQFNFVESEHQKFNNKIIDYVSKN
jgi:tetraacyldisaccharide 4'-kinase